MSKPTAADVSPRPRYEAKQVHLAVAHIEMLEKQAIEQAAEIKRLRDALQEVSRALGPYTRDPHEFAVGVIEDMQDIALNALVDNWAALKEQDND